MHKQITKHNQAHVYIKARKFILSCPYSIQPINTLPTSIKLISILPGPLQTIYTPSRFLESFFSTRFIMFASQLSLGFSLRFVLFFGASKQSVLLLEDSEWSVLFLHVFLCDSDFSTVDMNFLETSKVLGE